MRSKIQYVFLLLVLSLITSVASGQADIRHFQVRQDYVMNDSVVYTDTIRVSYMMKLTDKTDTDTVYVFLGNGPDKTNIDSAMFTISNNAGTYYATSTELGTYEIYGRMLIVEKTYLKSELSDPFWGTAYLINGSAQESEKKYYKNILP